MKKLIYAFASLSLVALVGLSACKKGSEPTTEFSINKTKVTLSVGEETKLTVSNYSGTVEWKSSDATVASITPSNGADCIVKGVKAGTATVTATNDGKSVSCVVTVEASEKEDAPEIAAPGAGLTTIAIRVPSGTCNGTYAIGEFQNKEGVANGWSHNKEGFAFEAVPGTSTWFAFTFKNDDSFTGLKVCAVPQKAAADWPYQWGMNKDGEDPNVSLVIEDADVDLDNSENQGEVKLTAAPANKVIYIDINAWKTAPCEPVNPAGPASFEVSFNLDGLNVVGAKVVGDWAADSEYGNWNPAAGLLLTKSGDKWTASGINVKEGFTFKVLVIFEEGAEYDWNPGLKDNQAMALDNNLVKTYSAADFQGLPEPDGE